MAENGIEHPYYRRGSRRCTLRWDRIRDKRISLISFHLEGYLEKVNTKIIILRSFNLHSTVSSPEELLGYIYHALLNISGLITTLISNIFQMKIFVTPSVLSVIKMVHPSELLRTNSNENRPFSAPRYVTEDNQLDCGFTNLPILNRLCNLERLAEPKVFLTFLSLVGFLQGVTISFFRETAKIWGNHYNISPENIDWLIYTNEFLVGVLAIFVSYYGNVIHRISWIGGLTMFQAIASAVLLVPEIYRKKTVNETHNDFNMCNTTTFLSNDVDINYIAFVILTVFQTVFAMASVSFISHGITYLDDNTSYKSSPGYIGIALASIELGKQAGVYLSWIPQWLETKTVFLSPVWLTLSSLVFISGVLIAMFPRNMPSKMVRAMAASLLDLAAGHDISTQKKAVDGFFKTIFRLLKNKILMTNIFCMVLLQSGLVNFGIFEKYFNQSRFQISHLNDDSYTQITTNILKQPLVAISLIATGMLAARSRPHLKSLVKWNIAALILVIIFFGSTAFLRCDSKKPLGYKATMWCDCNCRFDQFQPICLNSRTYFSPCVAGCSEKNETGYVCNCNREYQNHMAAEGSCEEKKCDLFYALSQGNRVITTALLASTLVTSLIINMRCILSRDKAAALGLQATFTGLVPYLPVKAVYGAVAEKFCEHRNERCEFYSKNFSTFLSIATIGFMVLSLVLATVVLLLLKFTPVKPEDGNSDDESADLPFELHDNPSREHHTLMTDGSRDEPDLRISGSANSVPDSLLEMENVGDDHDSIDSAEHLDEIPGRSRVLQSDF